MSLVAGVDGAKGAWLVAFLTDERVATLQLIDTFSDVVAVAEARGVECVGVDMPIAMPTNSARVADIEARALLGSRRSTLFPTPVAAVLAAGTYEEACAISRELTGKAISKQLWHLLPMVRQVRAALRPDEGDRYVEAHPESTFVQLTGQPLDSKKTASGVGQRLEALRPHVADLDGVLAQAPARCAIDDALDALAAAISARRFLTGEATVFGEGCDEAGYPLRIVA